MRLFTAWIYALFLFFSLGQLGRISFFKQEINFYAYEIILISGLFWLIATYRFVPLIKSYNRYKPIFVFFAILALSLAISLPSFTIRENVIASLYFVRLLFYFLFLFYASYYLKNKKKDTSVFLHGIFLFVGITLTTSTVQYFFYPDLRNLFYLGWDPHLFRVFGLFFDTSTAAAIYGLILLFFLFHKDLSKNTKMRFLVIVAFAVLSLLTYSRAFYLSFSVVFITYLAARRKYLSIVLFLFGLAGSLFLLPKPFGEGANLKRVFSIETRLDDYKTAFSLWKKNPILGIGYNHLRYAKQKTGQLPNESFVVSHSGASLHSSFLMILVTSGALGFAAFLWALLRIGSLSYEAAYYTGFLSIFSLFDNILLHPFVLFFYVSFLILLVRYR